MTTPADLLEQMAPAALQRFGSDRRWAAACNLPPETLSRLKKRESCDFRTLDVLAAAAGFTLVPARAGTGVELRRSDEERLLDLCASGNSDTAVWRANGDGFFMAGLAMVLASAHGFDRSRYLELAEDLHAGMSVPEVFDLWLSRTPVDAGRFLALVRHRRQLAA